MFTGPQVQPWTCQPGARDKQCDQPPTYAFFYKSTSATKSGFQPYDPQHPPSDVASTTTDQGTSVPFIVRVETGYEDRDQYKIATLFHPGQPWTWAMPQKQFNHKLLITHGASCDIQHAFPNGVCEFSKPGVDQQPTIPWMTYQTASGSVIYGGRPLGPPPASSAFG